MKELETLVKNIRKHRQLKGLLQTDLAAKVGLSSDTISKIELGVQPNIGLKHLAAICRELDVSIEELFLEDPHYIPLKIAVSGKNAEAVKAAIEAFKNSGIVK